MPDYYLLPEIEEDDPHDDDTLELHEHPPKLVPREEWGAQEPKSKEEFPEYPLPYLVAMHTRTRACHDKEDCKRAVKEIQEDHMARGEPDILYNYLIDMEGNIYIGRGPETVGMLFPVEHPKLGKANKKCIVVGYIGSGGFEPPEQLVFASGSLTSLLFDGKYIDEKLKFLWYEIPIEGFPSEDAKDEEKDKLRDHLENISLRMKHE